MRLKTNEIESIKSTILKYDKEAQVYIFGSRTDDTQRGGDIDILIISDKIKNKEIRKIRLELFDFLGEQKIDIISTPEINTAFLEYAYKTGIKI